MWIFSDIKSLLSGRYGTMRIDLSSPAATGANRHITLLQKALRLQGRDRPGEAMRRALARPAGATQVLLDCYE